MLVPLIFNEYAPDLDPTTPGACQDMAGVFCSEKGIRTLPGLSIVAKGLPSACFGNYTANLLGTLTLVAATANGLYVNQNGTFIEQQGGLTNTANRWRFAGYGTDIFGVDGVDPMFYYQQSTGAWSLAPNSPPVFAIVESTDWAVIGIPPNSNQLYSNFVPTAPWNGDATQQSYIFTLDTIAGNITAAHRSRSLLAVYRQNAIQCGTFVGALEGWDFGYPGTISLSVGAASQECVINTGDYHYIMGPDDFWSFDGYNLNRIPNHVKEWFFRDLNQEFIQNVAGRYDVLRDLVVWHYPSTASTKGTLDSYIGFYQRPNPPRWFFGRLPVELPLQVPGPDVLHTTTTPDSGLFLPDHNLYYYDDLNAFAPVSGCYVTSNDFGDRHYMFQTRRVRPGFTMYPTPQGANGGAPTQSSAVVAKCTPLVQMTTTGSQPVPFIGFGGSPSAVPISDDGWFNFLSTGRLTRLQVNFYGTAEIARGDVDLVQLGEV